MSSDKLVRRTSSFLSRLGHASSQEKVRTVRGGTRSRGDYSLQRGMGQKSDSASTFDESDSIDSMPDETAENDTTAVSVRDSQSTIGDESIYSAFGSNSTLKALTKPMLSLISRKSSTSGGDEDKLSVRQSGSRIQSDEMAPTQAPKPSLTSKFQSSSSFLPEESRDELPVIPIRMASSHSKKKDTRKSRTGREKSRIDRRPRHEAKPESRRRSKSKHRTKESSVTPKRRSKSRDRKVKKSSGRNSGSSRNLLRVDSGRSSSKDRRRPRLGKKSSSERNFNKSTQSPRSRSTEPRRSSSTNRHGRVTDRSNSRSPRSRRKPLRLSESRPILQKRYDSEKGLEAALNESQRKLMKRALARGASDRILSGSVLGLVSDTRPSLPKSKFLSERSLMRDRSPHRSSSTGRSRLTRRNESSSHLLDVSPRPTHVNGIGTLEKRLQSTIWYRKEVTSK